MSTRSDVRTAMHEAVEQITEMYSYDNHGINSPSISLRIRKDRDGHFVEASSRITVRQYFENK